MGWGSKIFGKSGGSESSSQAVQFEGLDADQLALRKDLMGYLRGILGQNDAIESKLASGNQFDYDPDAVNRYYQTSVYNPALRDLQENQVPALQSGLAKSGLLRSSWGARNMQKQQSDFANKMLENRAGLQEGERQDVRKLNAQGQLNALASSNAKQQGLMGQLLSVSKQVGNNSQSSSSQGDSGWLGRYNMLKGSF